MREWPNSKIKIFRTIVRIAQIGILLLLISSTLLALQSGKWQLWGVVITIALLLLLSHISLFLVQQNHFI
ncbi:MAG: hypothetical protein ACK8QZ_05420, partial [Anaerolineales bacterium]